MKGVFLIGGGIGAAALGAIIFEDSHPPDCSGASDTVDPKTGQSPRTTCEEERDEELKQAVCGATLLIVGVGVLLWGMFEVGSATVDALSEEPPDTHTRVVLAPCPGCRYPGVNVEWSHRF